MKKDKILHNSYNTGEIEYEVFPSEIKIDDRVASRYKDQYSEDMVEVRLYKALEERIYDIFLESPFYTKYKNPKKVEKGDLVLMYYHFKDLLKVENTYSNSQIFIGFAEFFQVNYQQLYSQVGVLDKEGLIKELNQYKVDSVFGKSKKLF